MAINDLTADMLTRIRNAVRNRASSVNGRNYMLDVLQARSMRDYYLMLTLYPRQTLDTRALLN